MELALRYGEGRIIVNEPDKGADGDTLHATESVCPVCKISLPAPSPQLFSFNSPQGACPRCAGLGTVEYFEPMLIAPNRGLSLNTKAILPWANPKTFARYEEALTALGKRFGFTLSTPLSAYSPEALQALFYGEDDPSQKSKSGLRRNRLGGSVALESPEYDDNAPAPVKAYDGPYKLATDNWPGVIPLLERGMQYGDMWRDLLSRYLQSMDCPTCHGARLRPESLAVRVDDLNIHQFCSLPVERALRWLNGREFDGRHALVAEPLLKELNHRLSFMTNVGLDYISLGRTMTTLSGGESQRIRLASQLGSGLVGVTYVLDEPSIGLHPRDNERLIATLRSLQGRGNTVLVVEHDEATIREADHIIELGPGSGAHGGDMVYHGSFENLIKHSETLTAKYMRGDLSVPIPDERREPKGWLTLRGVTTNNLKDIDCPIPLGTLTCVTGVSGSGKSSLVVDTLYKHLALAQGIRVDQPGSIRGIDGVEAIERIVAIDQTPIGRTPRSNPATYTRSRRDPPNIFAATPDYKRYQPGRFGFNVRPRPLDARGRGGDLGQIRVEMRCCPTCGVCCRRVEIALQITKPRSPLSGAEHLGSAGHAVREWPASSSPIIRSNAALPYWKMWGSTTSVWGQPPPPSPAARPIASRYRASSASVLCPAPCISSTSRPPDCTCTRSASSSPCCTIWWSSARRSWSSSSTRTSSSPRTTSLTSAPAEGKTAGASSPPERLKPSWPIRIPLPASSSPKNGGHGASSETANADPL